MKPFSQERAAEILERLLDLAGLHRITGNRTAA